MFKTYIFERGIVQARGLSKSELRECEREYGKLLRIEV